MFLDDHKNKASYRPDIIRAKADIPFGPAYDWPVRMLAFPLSRNWFMSKNFLPLLPMASILTAHLQVHADDKLERRFFFEGVGSP